MKPPVTALVFSTFLGFAPAALAAAPVALFDGKSFAGWEHDDSHWVVEEGAIAGVIPDGENLGRNLFLYWDGVVHDFDLTVEARVTGHASANSGVQFRSQRLADGHAKGYQADLDHGATWFGRIYDEHGRALLAERGTEVTVAEDGSKSVETFRPAKEFRDLIHHEDWNTYRIRAVGPTIETWINGEKASVLTDNQTGEHDFSGRLALQLHSGPGPVRIAFRKIELTDLGKTEPPAQTPPPAGRDGIVPTDGDGTPGNLGFERGTLEGWSATGDAWDGQPVEGDTVRPRRGDMASDHVGRFWAGGYEHGKGDSPRGTLESDPFKVTHPFASFLVGGGPHPETRVEIVDAESGDVLHTASGTERENLAPSVADLGQHMGKMIAVRLVDDHSGPWGHLNYDDFRFHGSKPNALADASRPARLRASPVLAHLVQNPEPPGSDHPAARTVANMFLEEGFAADLIAAEPDVRQPIAFTIDERGRLWVVEAFSYPQRQPEGEGKDRVLIFEDADRDGSFETRTVFTEGLNLVSAIEVGFGGVWVGAAPYLLFIPDADGDDQPDGEPEVLLDGWAYPDTHETPNSFTWGPDGWLYGNHGVFNTSHVGKPGTPDGARVTLRAAVWRYHPVRHTFEVFAHGGSNQWGLDFSETGDPFMTHCRSFWGRGPTTYVVHNGHYWNQANANYPPFVSGSHPPGAPHFRNFLLASARYGHGEGGAGARGSRAIYGGHSHIGTLIYKGDNWPERFRGNLFTHNLHGHQINRQINRRLGSGYETVHAGSDFAFTDDPLYLAVDLQTGPDGAVYSIDWSDRQQCHNPTMEKWDRSNGRIYRFRYTPTFQPRKVDLGALDDAALADLMTEKNAWFFETARRLLQERAATGTVDAGATEAFKALTESQNPVHALRGAWALHSTGALGPETLQRLLAHQSDHVRSWAVKLAADAGHKVDLLRLAQDDPSPHVRLAVASRLPELPADQAWPVAEALAAHAGDAGDAYLPKMVWFGIAPHVQGDLDRAFAFAEKTAMSELRDFIWWYSAKSAEGRDRLVAKAKEPDGSTLRSALDALAFSLHGAGRTAPPGGWGELAPLLYAHNDKNIGRIARELAILFGDEAEIARLRETLADPNADTTSKRRAFDTLARIGDAEAAPAMLSLLDEPEFRSDVLGQLGRSDNPAVAPALIARMARFSPKDRNLALSTLTARPAHAVAFLEAVAAGDLDRDLLTSLHVRQLGNLENPRVDALVSDLFGTVRETSADKAALVEKYAKEFREAALWAYETPNGQQLFDALCATCHAVNGKGGALGPDLAGSGHNGPEYFLENIVDPNAVVGENYQLALVTQKDGTVVTGLLGDTSADPLTVQTLAGPATLPQADIAKTERLEVSLMPEGLLDGLEPRQRIELLKYLASLR